jgi:hypothetical protein
MLTNSAETILGVHMFIRNMIFATGIIAIATRPGAGALAQEAIRQDPHPVLRQALVASGVVDEEGIQRSIALFDAKIGPIIEGVTPIRSEERRARLLYYRIGRAVLRKYVLDSGGIDDLLANGEFNCVSASLIYGLAARAAGLDAAIVESPRHVFVRLTLPKKSIDVECASPGGFDSGAHLDRFRRMIVLYKLATAEEVAGRGIEEVRERYFSRQEPVGLETGVAFVWHNRVERLLASGDGLGAALAMQEEARLHPDLIYRSDSNAVSIAQAYRLEYDRGAFENAFRVAAIDLALFPGRISAGDRLLAAAAKRVEEECDEGTPDRARGVISDLRRHLTETRDLERFEKGVEPLISEASLRPRPAPRK